MGADLKDAAAEMRAEHEKWRREQEERRAKTEALERETERIRRRTRLLMNGSLAMLVLFDLYLWGPEIIRALIRATQDWQALFHSFPNP